MKTLLIVVAALAAVASASVVSAQDTAPGGSEWTTRPAPGPSRSGVVAPVRVREKDRASAMANCDCPIMKTSAADCMMDMPGKRAPRPNG